MPPKVPAKTPSYEIAQPETVSTFAIRPDVPAPHEEMIDRAVDSLVREQPPAKAPRATWDVQNDRISPDLERRSLEAKGEGSSKAVSAIPEKRAVWVVHGMGQQIPFETLDSLTQGIMMAAGHTSAPRMRTVKIGDETVQRVEINVFGRHTHKPYELHLYESYWAPKTEGVAKLTDVVGFLKDGGFRGIVNSGRTFHRALFNTMESFAIPGRTPWMIVVALLTLLALGVVNAIILIAAAEKAGVALQIGIALVWRQLTALATWVVALALLFGAILTIASMLRANWFRSQQRILKALPTWLVWIAFAITILAVWFTAAAMSFYRVARISALVAGIPYEPLQLTSNLAIVVGLGLVGLAVLIRNGYRSRSESFFDSAGILSLLVISWMVYLMAAISLPALALGATAFQPGDSWLSRFLFKVLGSSWWVWPSLIYLAAQIREILVQFVGDVAIYVTPNKLDRFDEVRTAIKDSCRQTASAIYLAAQQSNEFLYKEIALVGHSLGSVIAYDTLNRLMLDDWLAGSQLHIADRTNSLITFGSPLEKTAFLFSIQGKNTLHVREQLAATVQPLIQSYPMFRKFPWINIYSPNDIVSGRLQFYDLHSMQPPRAVENIEDEDARIPLIAHIQYWNNLTLWNTLVNHIAP